LKEIQPAYNFSEIVWNPASLPGIGNYRNLSYAATLYRHQSSSVQSSSGRILVDYTRPDLQIQEAANASDHLLISGKCLTGYDGRSLPGCLLGIVGSSVSQEHVPALSPSGEFIFTVGNDELAERFANGEEIQIRLSGKHVSGNEGEVHKELTLAFRDATEIQPYNLSFHADDVKASIAYASGTGGDTYLGGESNDLTATLAQDGIYSVSANVQEFGEAKLSSLSNFVVDKTRSEVTEKSRFAHMPIR